MAKYGAQTSTDPYFPDAGNGMSSAMGGPITTNDPNDANIPAGVAFDQGYVRHLLGQWGSSTTGGVRYYVMDNEHSIWFSTQRDIHPVGPTMQEIWSRMLTNALMVKSNDPNALIVGPEEWGWSGYLYSGYDQTMGRAEWGLQSGGLSRPQSQWRLGLFALAIEPVSPARHRCRSAFRPGYSRSFLSAGRECLGRCG